MGIVRTTGAEARDLEAMRMRKAGATYEEIGRKFGVSPNYARLLVTDMRSRPGPNAVKSEYRVVAEEAFGRRRYRVVAPNGLPAGPAFAAEGDALRRAERLSQGVPEQRRCLACGKAFDPNGSGFRLCPLHRASASAEA